MTAFFAQLNGANVLFTVLTAVAASIVVLAKVRVLSRERYQESVEDQAKILGIRNELIATLEAREARLEDDKKRLAEQVARLETDNQWLRRRYIVLERRCEIMEETLRGAGLSVPRREAVD